MTITIMKMNMMMLRNIIYHTLVSAAVPAIFLFAACSSQDWPGTEAPVPGEEVVGQGSIAVQLQGAVQRATTTTITKEEADLFLVTISKGGELVSQQVQLGHVGTMTFPAGYGYKVSVENITEHDAETLNDGWGAKRYTGDSKAFGIQAGQTTSVSVSCTVANAAVSITIDDAVSGCTVTVSDGSRTLTTDEDRVAYFNVTDISKPVTLIVEKDGTVVSEQNLDLEAAQVKDVNIGASEDPEDGTISVTITYDESFVIVPEDIVIGDE